MPDRLDAPDRPISRRRRFGRLLAAFATVVVPALAIALLTAIWVRSIWIDEQVEFGHDVITLDRATTGAVRGGWQLEIETARGVLGVSFSNSSWTFSQLPPEMFDSFAERRQKEDGWKFRHINTAEVPSFPERAYRPFDRDRQTVGWTKTLQWNFKKTIHEPGMVGGFIDGVSAKLVAPCWFWMLPWLLPPIWWWWCPPGRMIPRLTLRRTALATAIIAVILSAPAALYRSAAEDRALMALGDLQGHWDYGPDPAGSGRQVVTKVSILSFLGDPPEPYPGRLAAVLRSFPALQILYFSGSQQVVSADGFIPIIDDHPGLKELVVPPQADDRSMEAIGRCRNLRDLSLSHTRITGAGLVYLARHPNLESLSLKVSQCTEAGLNALHGLPKLRQIMLTDDTVSPMTGETLATRLYHPQGKSVDAALKRLAETLPSFER